MLKACVREDTPFAEIVETGYLISNLEPVFTKDKIQYMVIAVKSHMVIHLQTSLSGAMENSSSSLLWQRKIHKNKREQSILSYVQGFSAL